MRWFALTAILVPLPALGAPFPGVPGDGTASGGEVATWTDVAVPTPLSSGEENSGAALLLARRFNPGMAFAHDDIWPVEVRYAWHDGAPLVGRVRGVDGQVKREFEALSNERLAAGDFGDLAITDEEGDRIDYLVDAPGDDRLTRGVSNWRRRFRAIQGRPGADEAHPQYLNPALAPYAPTQYAHLFWWNRERGLLALQYWFFYPYNEWINHHEGDWEHINVIVRGPTRLTEARAEMFSPVAYQFFFHEFAHEPSEVIRVGGPDDREDHVVVYVGGKSQFLGWTGVQSGGSYPLPALFPRTGGGFSPWRPDDDVRRPARFLPPQLFNVVLLPEPERLDVGAQPELAWLRVNFFAGQTHMHGNPLTLNHGSFGAPPRQPARQETWNAAWRPPLWAETARYDGRSTALPRGLARLQDPPRVKDETRLSTRRGAARPPQRARAGAPR